MRLIKFNAVGAAGIVVQLVTVHGLLTWTPVGAVAATALGVTLAVVHNFVWHRHWTWADRRHAHRHVLAAFAHFALANGGVSLAGGVLVVLAAAVTTPAAGVIANLAAIVLCGAVNFLLSDRLVFRSLPNGRPSR